MHLRILAFLACLAVAAIPVRAPARADADGCATSPARIAQQPHLEIAPDAKITSKRIAYEVEVGSDGGVRGLQLAQSSGDKNVDLSLRQGLQSASYEPPQTGCVAYSGGLYLAYELPLTAPGAPAVPAVPRSDCTPFVHTFLSPVKRDRTHTGTAVVAVPLDAAGTLAGPPTLHQRTGNAQLDAEALRLARTGQYGFLVGSACAPQPFTYNLELTFQ